MLFSQVFVKRPVMAIAVNLALLIIGIVAYHQLELRHTPNAPNNDIRISTVYPGANSLAVEQQITKPLEDALAGVDGIKKMNSSSQDGHSHINLTLKPGSQGKEAISQIRDRIVSAMPSLPENAKRPEIQEQSEENRTLMYIEFEDKTRSIRALTDYIKRVVEDRLRLVNGVANLGHYGNQMYLISIKPDPALLLENKLTVSDLMNVLKKEKTFASGGEIEGVTGKETVILTAIVEKPEDFGKLTLKNTPKGRLTIGDVAEISVDEKPTYLKMRVNGRYTVGLSVIPKPQANPLQVAQNVKNFVTDMKRHLPSTMRMAVNYDATQAFNAAFIEMRHTLWEAIILVGIIVTLSLASVRAALFPMITVPLCLVGSFALMLLFGFSINPITLLALVLAVGLVVDDAIVVVENIHRHMEAGQNRLQAALNSMKEITFAVVVMTITLAAVYVPLVFQSNDSSAAFREFAWTLAGSVIISGFVALTLTPALCGKYLKGSEKITAWERLSEGYQHYLTLALANPGKILLLLVLVAGLGAWGFQRLPAEYMPVEDESYLQGNINVDNSVANNVRDSWFEAVEDVLKTVPEQVNYLTGVWQEKWMWLTIILKPAKERDRTAREIAADLKTKLAKIPGPQVMIVDNPNFSGEEPFKIIIQYAGDQQKLMDAIREIMKEARKVSGFSAVMSEQAWEKPRLKVTLDRALAAELGVNLQSLEDTLSIFLSGRKATDFNFQGLDYEVQVRAPAKHRTEFTHINEYFVSGSDGQWVPLGSLISAKETLDPNQIEHFDRMRGGVISITLDPAMAIDKAIEILEPVVKKHLPMDARYRFGGKAEQYREASQNMWLTFGLALAFIYLVLAALFESFIYPFIVLMTVPLSIVGAVWAVNFIGGTNNIYTTIGLVTLIGLITKHGILIIDFTNRLRAEGMRVKEALLTAASSRLRPVLMTTFAMICGAIPLVMSVGSGAIAREHIGWIIIGGMITGTLFSLFVIPVVYQMVARKF